MNCVVACAVILWLSFSDKHFRLQNWHVFPNDIIDNSCKSRSCKWDGRIHFAFVSLLFFLIGWHFPCFLRSRLSSQLWRHWFTNLISGTLSTSLHSIQIVFLFEIRLARYLRVYSTIYYNLMCMLFFKRSKLWEE